MNLIYDLKLHFCIHLIIIHINTHFVDIQKSLFKIIALIIHYWRFIAVTVWLRRTAWKFVLIRNDEFIDY